MADEITFLNNTGAPAPLTVRFSVLGTFIPSIQPFRRIQSHMDVLAAGFTYDLGSTEITRAGGTWLSSSISAAPAGMVGAIFEGIVPVPAGQFTTNFNMDLEVNCAFGNTCDFGNTVTIDLILPLGVTYSSASGVFLTGNSSAAPIPEPATATTALAALGAVLAFGRLR